MTSTAFVLAVALLTLSAACAPVQPDPLSRVDVPPSGKLYHGVYPGGITGDEDDITAAGLNSYEQTVGKTAAWCFFSHQWFHGQAFPMATARWIRDAGSVPYVRLMMRSDSEEIARGDPVYSLARIIHGDFDPALTAWADSARSFGSPLIAEYGTEMNGQWFPWNGVWNGGDSTGGYGSPDKPDGPERFVDAYRHIIRLCRERGATNVLWVFHVNDDDDPEEAWNRFENYYPGDEWIDWLAMSVYGVQHPDEPDWIEFRPAMDSVYARLARLAPGKPVVLVEFGVANRNPHGDQAAWADSALTDIVTGRWPGLIGFSWWNERWQNDDDSLHDTDMRVQDNPTLARVFREHVANDNILGRARFTVRRQPSNQGK